MRNFDSSYVEFYTAFHNKQDFKLTSSYNVYTAREWSMDTYMKSDCLGCAVLLCLVCLFDLACFFLSSFSSLI